MNGFEGMKSRKGFLPHSSKALDMGMLRHFSRMGSGRREIRKEEEEIWKEVFCTNDEYDFNEDIHVNSSDVFNVHVVSKTCSKRNDYSDVKCCDQYKPVETSLECSIMRQDESRFLQWCGFILWKCWWV